VKPDVGGKREVRRMLITGAEGQLGWELVRHCARKDMSHVGLSRQQLDLTRPEQIWSALREIRPRVVINAAAYTAVDRAESEPELAHAVNASGPRELARACQEVGALLIHVSTDYVFSGRSENPYREADATEPQGVYGQSKWSGEEQIRQALERHLIVRTAWVYGVHGNNFVKTMLRLGAERPQLRVVDDQWGNPTFASDLAEALLQVLQRGGDFSAPEQWGTFHCVNAGVTTWFRFAQRILAELLSTGHLELQPIPSHEYPTPVKRPLYSALNCDRMEQTFGVKMRPWEQALEEMLERTQRRLTA
jgi:dTDP-4-dehydrorhamnose reductase